MAGPFAGLQYPVSAVGSALGPKLLGSYEKELHEVIDDIIDHQYTTIIDIGAAEGYYAVGLLKRIPQAKLIAFEQAESGRESLHHLAKINGVADRLKVEGHCAIDQLAQTKLNDDSLIICDVEGAEIELLDPTKARNLHQADILVELHQHIVADVEKEIYDRFKSTHEILKINSEPRTPADLPKDLKNFRRIYSWAASERRLVEMSWYWMKVINTQELD